MWRSCREVVGQLDVIWSPTEEGRQLEQRYGPLPWLHPKTATAWPPSFDQV